MNTTFRTPVRPMRKVSEKRRIENETYTLLRRKFLEKHPMCQWGNCFNRSVDIHHGSGRYGKNYLDITTWFAFCRGCHNKVHNSPNEARRRGYLK